MPQAKWESREATEAYVLVSPELGVYLGNALGLGFWSKLDAAGQLDAVAFANPEIAMEFAATWDTQVPNLTCVKVDAFKEILANSDIVRHFASMKACVKAGLDPWDVEE